MSSSALRTARYSVRPASSRSSSARESQSCALVHGSVIAAERCIGWECSPIVRCATARSDLRGLGERGLGSGVRAGDLPSSLAICLLYPLTISPAAQREPRRRVSGTGRCPKIVTSRGPQPDINSNVPPPGRTAPPVAERGYPLVRAVISLHPRRRRILAGFRRAFVRRGRGLSALAPSKEDHPERSAPTGRTESPKSLPHPSWSMTKTRTCSGQKRRRVVARILRRR